MGLLVSILSWRSFGAACRLSCWFYGAVGLLSWLLFGVVGLLSWRLVLELKTTCSRIQKQLALELKTACFGSRFETQLVLELKTALFSRRGRPVSPSSDSDRGLSIVFYTRTLAVARPGPSRVVASRVASLEVLPTKTVVPRGAPDKNRGPPRCSRLKPWPPEVLPTTTVAPRYAPDPSRAVASRVAPRGAPD